MTKKLKKNKYSKRESVIAVVIVLCFMIIAGWEIAAKLASKPFDELRLKPEAFSGFIPNSKQWNTRLIHTKSSPTEPTVVAYELRPNKNSYFENQKSSFQSPLLSRIVHGYNMVDCMRIKQYKVELVLDTRTHPPVKLPPSNFKLHSLPPLQAWKLTSSEGESSIWITSMLRSADFATTSVDTRDMAFPRVGSPDDPSWAPTGLKLSSFRHPIRNARNALKARWNSSRCDMLTFLRLRQPAWASDEMLTMVTEYHGPSVPPEQEDTVLQYTIQAHSFMLKEFQTFWKNKE